MGAWAFAPSLTLGEGQEVISVRAGNAADSSSVVHRCMLGGPCGDGAVLAQNAVDHSQRSAPNPLQCSRNFESIIEACALVIVNFAARDGEVQALIQVGFVASVMIFEPLHSSLFEEARVIGVMHDPHGIGFVESHAMVGGC